MKKSVVIITLIMALFVSIKIIPAITYEELSTFEQMDVSSIGYNYNKGGEDAAYEYIVNVNSKALTPVSSKVIQYCINYGLFINHIDDLKALGYTDVDYSPVLGGGSKANTTEQTAQATQTPEPFTVEPYNPAKTMWATSEVNCRTGAGTSYQKVGSLKKHEEVKVTGVASNGWYEITKEDGTKIYVSNKYLSEENPSDRVVYDVNEETGKVTTYEFKDTDPEVIDEKVEELTATPEPTVAPTEKPTPTPTVEPTIAPTAEPTPYVVELTEEEIKQLPEETQDELKTDGRNYIGFIVLAVAFVGIVAIVVIRNHKKR